MLLIRNAEIIDPGRAGPSPGLLSDVRVQDGVIAEIGRSLAPRGERVVDAQGGTLIRGLHDHHMHLFALAAARESVQCGPPAVTSLEELSKALRDADVALKDAGPERWIRGVGYHESVAGELDSGVLDRILPDRPVRVQHRGGMAWTVNSVGARRLGLDSRTSPAGVERNGEGGATGRLFRLDEWLGAQTGERTTPDIAAASRELAGFGVTGITDASYANSCEVADRVRTLQSEGVLMQHVRLMGDEMLNAWAQGDPAPRGTACDLEIGELKILLDEAALPDYGAMCGRIARAHFADRAVALHCVTFAELVFGISALRDAGVMRGDRIEHGSEMRDEAMRLLQESGITVVTQPNFVRERGDRYRQEVEPSLLDFLYRVGSPIAQGVPLAAGTDAPYGDPNPWSAMWAAVERKTANGATLGAAERIAPERALALFGGTPARPAESASSIAPGMGADLCLLENGWRETRLNLADARVCLTVRRGDVIHET